MALLFVDSSGGIYRTDIDTGRTVRLADFAQTWTDIAVTPNGRVFTTTFNGLYEINLNSGKATFVHALSGSANGLGSDAAGRLYVGSGSSGSDILVLSSKDFSIVNTIDLPAGVASAGDIHISGNKLYFSTTTNRLLTINLTTEAVISNVFHGITNLFGLHSEKGILYGLAQNDVYRINPTTGSATLVDDLPTSGSVYGSATLAGVVVRGTASADTILADAGGSTVFGFSGRDILVGDAGGDKIYGGAGRDYLFGNGGNDSLFGGTGHDILDGGRGADRLYGGSGPDNFVFEVGDGRDHITGFANNVDTLEISAAFLGSRPKTVNMLLSTFASTVAGDVVLDFGARGHLVIDGVASRAALLDDIILI